MAKFVQTPDTFSVEEVPLFEPCGAGEHLYVRFLRRDMSTPSIASELRKRLKIKEAEIGCAGNKDKLSTAIQTFSLPARLETKILAAFNDLGMEVVGTLPHSQKLRMGVLAGNRFKLVIDIESPGDGLELLESVRRLADEGLPNFYGPQRVSDERSFERGKAFFLGKAGKGGSRRDRFLVSVFQSRIFNEWLKARIEKGLFPAPAEGDLMLDPISERLFYFDGKPLPEGDISFTGPIIGSRMRFPKDAPLEIEKETIGSFGVSFDSIALARAPGARRPAKVAVGELKSGEIEGGKMEISFFLPKGCYATTLLQQAGVEVSVPEREPEK